MNTAALPAPAAPSKIQLILHAIMFLFSIIVLALAAVVIWTYSGYYGIGGPGYNIFCCILTWIICIYVILSATVLKKIYNRVVHTIMLAAGTIFWLSAWASMAAWAAAFGLADTYSGNLDSYYYGDLYSNRSPSQIRTGWQCAAAAAGLGALIFLLFIANFILNLVAFFRDRRLRREATNNPNAYNPAGGAPTYGAGIASPAAGAPAGAGYYAENKQQQQYPQQNYPMQTMSPAPNYGQTHSPAPNYGQQDQYPHSVDSPAPGGPNSYPHQPQQHPPYPTQ